MRPGPQPAHHRRPPGRRGDREPVRRSDQQRHAEALARLYEDDAVLLPPDHQPIEGRAAIGEFWRQGTDEGLEVTTLRLDVEGGIGYLVAQYTLPETEEEPADSGKAVMCLKRQRDGSWKVTADIWNSSVGDEDDDEDDTTPAPSVS